MCSGSEQHNASKTSPLAPRHESPRAPAVVHLDRIGRLDVTSASALRTVVEEAQQAGLQTELTGIEERDRRLIDRLVEADADPLAG